MELGGQECRALCAYTRLANIVCVHLGFAHALNVRMAL